MSKNDKETSARFNQGFHGSLYPTMNFPSFASLQPGFPNEITPFVFIACKYKTVPL